MLIYGDPRGKRNDGHDIMIYPTWKLARIVNIMNNNNSIISEYFKEMFYCLNYFHKKKRRLSNSTIDVYGEINVNALYVNEANIIAHLERIVIKENEPLRSSLANYNDNNNDELCDLNEDDIERPSDVLASLMEHMRSMCVLSGYPLHKLNFQSDVLNCNDKLNDVQFPSISDTAYQYHELFFGEKMFVMLLKQLSMLFFNAGSVVYSCNDDATLNTVMKCCYHNKCTLIDECLLNSKMNIKHNLPRSMVFAWGSNDKNQTSHDGYNQLSCPRMVYKLKHIDVSTVKCGTEFNLGLSTNGKVYAWGNNNKGQCGVRSNVPGVKANGHYGYYYGKKNNIIVNDPTVIKELTVGSVMQVSCGDEHALALMNDKKVFSWGNKELGVLGYNVNVEYQTTPKEIAYFTTHNINVCNVVCGSVHNIAIDSKGCLYGWGDNKAGQLGLSGLSSEEYFTTPIKIDNTRYNIVSLAMKELHSIGVNAYGNVFSWGSSPNGQLGVGTCMHNKLAKASLIAQTQQYKVTTPTHITTLNNVAIANVECGGAFSMFISNDGCLYACGLNDQGQLGINNDNNNARDVRSVRDCKDITRPIRVECFVNDNMKVVKIACGESHCVAIVKEMSKGCTSLWSWGNNKFGQLGMGSECRCNVSSPRRVKYFEGFKWGEVVDVACGFQHSVCVVRNVKGIGDGSDEENGERVVKECVEIICDVYDNMLNN